MHWIDWAILGIVLFSVIGAALQGFVSEVISLAGAVFGFLLAAWEYPAIAARVQPYVKESSVADLIGFLAVFFAVLLLAGFIAKIARWIVRHAGLNWVDRLLGAAFGLARGVITVAVLVMALAAFEPGTTLLRNSQLAAYFVVAARGMSWVAPSVVRQRVREGALALRRAADAQGRNTP
ncbi:MAG: CvpA family protein [Acidobacteria bacterium]|nr:CvpA family protein [Acidobacteriaceae bacterium]MBV9610042.1 CvpA family protein [Acidobacteriota bacterium]